ncbi:hypothetical protein CN938_22315, partial [Bacillus thuringiensis]
MADAPKLNGNEYLDESYYKINLGIENANVALNLASEPITKKKIVTGAVTPAKTSFFSLGKNKFDVNTITAGYYVDSSNGKLVPSAGFNASDYIKVKPNTYYTKTYGYFYAWYDEQNVFISGGNSSSSPTTMLAPSNASYLRVSITDSLKATLQVEEGITQSSYEP